MRNRRLLAAFAAIVALWGCQQQPERQAAAPRAETESAPVVPTLVVADLPLDRQALLLAVAQAASAYALAQSDTENQNELAGKRFELRLRFGCGAPGGSDGDEARSWTFDKKRRLLSLRVEPGISDHSTSAGSLGVAGYEAVEGFWIRRPWLLTAACPAASPEPAMTASPGPSPQSRVSPPSRVSPSAAVNSQDVIPTPAPVQKIGIAQFFTEADARTHRRNNRAYTTNKVLDEGKAPSEIGYDLVITGRLQRLADERVIVCRGGGQVPPDCTISAVFDNVAIDDPRSGETIAKWSNS